MNYEGSDKPYERQISDHKRRLIAEIRKGITGRVEIAEGEMEALIATRHCMGYMLNFTREHVLILDKAELMAFAWLILWDLDRLFFDWLIDVSELLCRVEPTGRGAHPSQNRLMFFIKEAIYYSGFSLQATEIMVWLI